MLDETSYQIISKAPLKNKKKSPTFPPPKKYKYAPKNYKKPLKT